MQFKANYKAVVRAGGAPFAVHILFLGSGSDNDLFCVRVCVCVLVCKCLNVGWGWEGGE